MTEVIRRMAKAVPTKAWIGIGLASIAVGGFGTWLHKHDQYVAAKALAVDREAALDSVLDARERILEELERRSEARADSLRVLQAERDSAREEAEEIARRYEGVVEEVLAEAPPALRPEIVRLDSLHAEEVAALQGQITVLESENALLRGEVSELRMALEASEEALHRALEQKGYWRDVASRGGVGGTLGTVAKVVAGAGGAYAACRANLLPGC